jgi:hypothetical protein
MKLSKPICPTCGEPAIGTCDTIPGIALFDGCPTGGNDVEWDGETEVCWNGQMTDLDSETKLPLVCCHNGHDWPSKIKGDPRYDNQTKNKKG